jgi:hypothetical protein
MAKPKCFYCDGLVFELVAIEILDCANPHKAIQCAKCGCPIGVVPVEDVSRLLAEQADRQAGFRVSIHSRLELIEARLSRIVEASQG